MNLPTHLSKTLRRNLGMLAMTLEDFSDAELLVRPVPGANHANWQIGHLILSEHNMVAAAGAPMPELPAGFAQKYSREAAAGDDPSQFLKKDALIAAYQEVRAVTATFALQLSEQALEDKSPEGVRPLAPTVADLMTLLSLHMTMHLGQMQVIRRKLGKPVLF